MAISTNQKPTIYRNLYENTGPDPGSEVCSLCLTDYSQMHIKFINQDYNEFRGFLSQFSTNFHEILHTLFSMLVVTTQKSFDKYFKN